jgi:hypothetical protein
MALSLHEFATSRLRRFKIPSHRAFATPRLREFETPSAFATPRLREFQIPDLRDFFVPENIFHEFHEPRRFEGDRFPEFPNSTLLLIIFQLLCVMQWRKNIV